MKLALVFYAVGLLLYLLPSTQSATALQKLKSLPRIDLRPYSSFLQSLTPSLISAVIIFIFGYSWRTVAARLGSYRAKFFWGPGLFGPDLVICHGTLVDPRLQQSSADGFRFVKEFRDGRKMDVVGPSESVVGDSEVRSMAYLVSALSKYRRNPVSLESDRTCYKRLSRTCVALGSASSNEMTEIILREKNNVFLDFSLEGDTVYIVHKRSGKKYAAFKGPIQRDLGLILKIRNSRFKGHYLFVCAGVGDWGTSGAAWYLANKWRELDNMGEEFGEIVQVEIGSDESARPVGP